MAANYLREVTHEQDGPLCLICGAMMVPYKNTLNGEEKEIA